MTPNRRDLLKLAAAAAPLRASSHPSGQLRLDAPAVVRPLSTVTVHGASSGTLVVRDGRGREYVRVPAKSPFAFRVGGSLGRHTVQCGDPVASFDVDAVTELSDAGGEFRDLLHALEWTMLTWDDDHPVGVIRHQGRIHQMFVYWLMDHAHTLKGLKYFWPELKGAVDFFADTQREDGMIFENCYPHKGEPNYFDWKTSYGGFVRAIEGGKRQLRRAPVESHVEQFFVEALYATWQATGDDAWMATRLDNAIRGLRYLMSDPYRWSKKYQLVHRGLTIDTWDYVSDDQFAVGGSGFVVHLGKSEFGVMFGDNTNLIVSCANLARMLEIAGRRAEAAEWRSTGEQLQRRLDALAWNGRFYTHWIAENPDYKPDFGVDTSEQVALSNAYSLNRGIGQDKCVAIIREYQRIAREMPASSPGEFYSMYPPFAKNFREPWEYVNGGVVPFVAGELAHGAFENGFEAYGADILRRMKKLVDRYDRWLPAALRGKTDGPPQRTFQKLDLRRLANARRGDGLPGLVGRADGIPSGEQMFCDVPFDVLAGPEVCLGLAARQYAKHAKLTVDSGTRSLYLLHARSGGSPCGTLTWQYADGSSESEYLADGVNVGNWWEPVDGRHRRQGPMTLDRLRVAWRGANESHTNVGVYAAGFDNPHPNRTLTTVRLDAAPTGAKWFVLAATTSDAPVYFKPWNDLSHGLPEGWGAGAVTYALVEGLCGVRDGGRAFDKLVLSPRWAAAGVNECSCTIRYPASEGYCAYRYSRSGDTVRLEWTGNADTARIEVLLPEAHHITLARLDGRDTAVSEKVVEKSLYAALDVNAAGVHVLELQLAAVR